MIHKGEKLHYGYYGDCPECPLICRVFTNDVKRPEAFKKQPNRDLTPEEKLQMKLRRAEAPKGLYDNPYNPGAWRRSPRITAPYTSD
ncbi:unnamed protein product [Heterobilharzia americana]|nr:unnamed protein product [Heterobilharzia americana]